jgi:hypothetical protein
MNPYPKIFILLTIAAVFLSVTGKDISQEIEVLEKTQKKYANKKQPFKNTEPTSFKFLALSGEYSTTESGLSKIKEKPDSEFSSIKTAITLIRNPGDKSNATIVGNIGTSPAVVVVGILCVTFLEVTRSGVVQNLTITDCWDEKNGGFVAIYTRVVSFNDGVKYTVGSSRYHGVAIPWD